MISTVDWTQLIAGLGLFMLGMSFLERSLRSLLNQAAVQVMKTSTSSLWMSIPVGTMLTLLMQSSSLVGLLVLAFVGAGVMPMRNALGVIMGANLGTTFTGWIVTLLGFKLQLGALALPLMGLGAIVTVWVEQRRRWLSVGQLLLGLGFLLFGLDAMKSGVEAVAEQTSMEAWAGWPLLWFFGVGIVLAAVIQSSSAVVMLSLSGVHAGLLDFPSAAAVVVGADIGTTSTMLLASSRGALVKRQVAVFHLIYNVFTAVFALLVLLPLVEPVFSRSGIDDVMYRLVIFHSSFNFFGIFLIVPFLQRIADWIERTVGKDADSTRYLHRVPPVVPEAALVAMRQETELLFARVLRLLEQAYSLESSVTLKSGEQIAVLPGGFAAFIDAYEELQHLESAIADYSRSIQPLDEAGREEQEKWLEITRFAMYAAKSVKDVLDDLELLYADDEGGSKSLRSKLEGRVAFLIAAGQELLLSNLSHGRIEALEKEHGQVMADIQQGLYQERVAPRIGFSSLMNVVRETDECGRELLRLMKTWASTGKF